MNRPVAHPTLIEQEDLSARFTAGEYLHMVEAGVFEDMKVELVAGRLERMNPAMSPHGKAHGDVYYELRSIFGPEAGFEVLIDTVVAIDETSILAGDVSVVRDRDAQAGVLRPEEIVLQVEVSVSTIGRDTGTKRLAYAAAGIPLYWVVDPERQVTHVYAAPAAGDYAEVSTVRFGQPLPVPGTGRTIVLG